MIPINSSITIPDDEFELTFSRSQGPGGQNVNKVNSKVTLHWNLTQSKSVPQRIRHRIRSKHAGKINKQGKLVISSQKSREQHQNRADCFQKLRALIIDALKTKKRRKPTKPTKASKRRRLDQKKRRSDLKAGRQSRYDYWFFRCNWSFGNSDGYTNCFKWLIIEFQKIQFCSPFQFILPES